MAKPTQLPLVERLLDGRLRDLLADSEVSFTELSFRLRTQHDINVGAETLRRWALDQYGLPPRSDKGEAALAAEPAA